ncbi:hypothetical protein R3P38DRAFT_3172063 [Favolaschia claudopus]|uniref:Uncharacterized protein n=1 Tax=Favolaschia claudopus TaxID=2862362 RepID=A0AAW0DJH8_9AGAR
MPDSFDVPPPPYTPPASSPPPYTRYPIAPDRLDPPPPYTFDDPVSLGSGFYRPSRPFDRFRRWLANFNPLRRRQPSSPEAFEMQSMSG